MNKIALAFLTKDRPELSRQTIAPLLKEPSVDVFWIDGSITEEGQRLPDAYAPHQIHRNIRGGADAAIVYALTTLLEHQKEHPFIYKYIGLVENDVLLTEGWQRCFDLFNTPTLSVGAVSARCYEDRILIQRDGYAVCHNLGAGMLVLTREAARIILDNYRTQYAPENRRVFAQLSGIDIGRYWAFRTAEHWLTADWGFETHLARKGLASLALTPSCVEMLGQDPPLAEQGLKLVTEPKESAGSAVRWRFENATRGLRDSNWQFPCERFYREPAFGSQLFFAHQLANLSRTWTGEWGLRWSQGFGPFAWESKASEAALFVSVTGACEFLVSGEGQVEIQDARGYVVKPELSGNIISVPIPGGIESREIKLIAKNPGVIVHALVVREPQLLRSNIHFDYSHLPKVS